MERTSASAQRFLNVPLPNASALRPVTGQVITRESTERTRDHLTRALPAELSRTTRAPRDQGPGECRTDRGIGCAPCRTYAASRARSRSAHHRRLRVTVSTLVFAQSVGPDVVKMRFYLELRCARPVAFGARCQAARVCWRYPLPSVHGAPLHPRSPGPAGAQTYVRSTCPRTHLA